MPGVGFSGSPIATAYRFLFLLKLIEFSQRDHTHVSNNQIKKKNISRTTGPPLNTFSHSLLSNRYTDLTCNT